MFFACVVPFMIGMTAGILWIGLRLGFDATFEVTDWMAGRR